QSRCRHRRCPQPDVAWNGPAAARPGAPAGPRRPRARRWWRPGAHIRTRRASATGPATRGRPSTGGRWSAEAAGPVGACRFKAAGQGAEYNADCAGAPAAGVRMADNPASEVAGAAVDDRELLRRLAAGASSGDALAREAGITR